MRERLGRTVAGNNSDTAACGVRNNDVRDEIGSPKAAVTFPRPHRHRRRRAHRFIHASSLPPPPPPPPSTAAAAAHEGLPEPSADRPASRLVDGRGYIRTDTRAHTQARSHTHTRTQAHTHTRTHARQHAHTDARTRTHGHSARTSPAASEVVGFRSAFGPPSRSAVLFHSPPNADRRRSRKLH